MESDGFNTKALMLHTGVSQRQLNHWDSLGIVSPSIQPAQGSGSRRRYSVDDLFMVLLVRTMREEQVPLKTVREAVSALRTHTVVVECDPQTVLVCAQGRVVYLGGDQRRIGHHLNQTPALLIFHVGRMAARAAELTATMPSVTVELLEVAGRLVQVVVAPHDRGFKARCNAHPGYLGEGPTAERAMNALRAAIEHEHHDDKARPRTASTKSIKPKPKGASAWGAGW